MKTSLGMTAIALAFVGAFGLFGATASLAQETAAPAATTATAPAADAAAPAVVEVKDFGLGPEDAKVKVIEYASFTCPHCARFHEEVFKPLKADYIDTGKIRFEYREVYFDRYGLWAAMIARCGGDMRYFGIAARLFETQAEWAASEDPSVVVENLKTIGRAAGMDDAAMDVCMKDAANAKAMMTHYETNFKADGIEGTPTFLINGTVHKNMTYVEMKALIDAELAK